LAALSVFCCPSVPVRDLPLQVGVFHAVGVDKTDASDARGCEIERSWAAEAARTDEQHAAGLEAALTLGAEFRQHEVAAIAAGLGRAELGQ
jgi:hypothetical protein